MDIKYKVCFHTDWHCGSGLSAGADIDVLTIKDKDGLPFVPGKTIKGLVKEAVEDLLHLRKQDSQSELFDRVFGKEAVTAGCTFWSNAELSEMEKKSLLANNAAGYLYRSLSNTAIGEDGIAVQHSLRRIQVTVPCVLEGTIMNLPDESLPVIYDALKYIKRLGYNRNRGLGRCSFLVE